MSKRVLIVEDDDITREILVSMLVNRGFACDQASNGRQALEMLGAEEYDVVVTDIAMPLMTGIELMEKSADLNLRASFIIITAYASLETALEALRKGAYDYLLKPLNFEDVAIKVKKLLEHKELVQENQALRQEINAQYDFSNIIGKSPAIRKLFATIRKVSDSDSHVLITGNSGTGKELVAKAIHYNSPRRKGRFVAINCGAVTETLMESELFGHKRGSFTGAVADKDGLFTGPFSSTKSAICHSPGRPNCCAPWRTVRSSRSGRPLSSPSTSASSQRPTAISGRRSRRAGSAKTSTIASMS